MDLSYVIARDKLIPQACRLADARFSRERKSDWCQEYLRQMDVLARETGLVLHIPLIEQDLIAGGCPENRRKRIIAAVKRGMK